MEYGWWVFRKSYSHFTHLEIVISLKMTSGVNGSRFCKWSQDHLKTVRNSVLSVLSVPGFDMDFLKQISKCPEAPSPDWGGGQFCICLFYVSDNFKEKIFENFFGRQTLFLYNKKTRENSNVGYGFFPVRREKS